MGLYVSITYFYFCGKEMKGNILDVYQLEKIIEVSQYFSTFKKIINYLDFKDIKMVGRGVL